jgi:hypothetical protein
VKNFQELIMPTTIEKSSHAIPELKDTRLFREACYLLIGLRIAPYNA